MIVALLVIIITIGIILFITPFVMLKHLEEDILNDNIDPLRAYDLLLVYTMWNRWHLLSKILFFVMYILLWPIIILFIIVKNKLKGRT